MNAINSQTALVKWICSYVLVGLILAGSAARTYGSIVEPITEERLLALLRETIPVPEIILAIRERGVAFQLTDWFKQEIRTAAPNLGERALDDLFSAIGDNFREPAQPAYRLTYRILVGHAVDFLLSGMVDKFGDPALEGPVSVARNSVFENLFSLVTAFSDDFNRDRLSVELGVAEGTDNSRLAQQLRDGRKKLFVGSGGNLSLGYTAAIVDFDPAPLVDSVTGSDESWRLRAFTRFEGRPPKPVDNLQFIRPMNRSDFQTNTDTLSRFYSHITRDYVPPDFGFTELSVTPNCGEGQEGRTAKATMVGPLMSVMVAIIQNISTTDPLVVGRFLIKGNSSERLRTREEDKTARDSQALQKIDLFPAGVLRPNERLVVPLEMRVKMAEDSRNHLGLGSGETNTPEKNSEMLTRTRDAGGLRLIRSTINPAPISTMTVEQIERVLNRGEFVFQQPKEYIYGPSLSIESMELNKYGYLVRQFDPTRIMVTSYDYMEGSCPYVFTYSATDNAWRNEGVILYGNRSELKESSDQKTLRHFDGRILLKELDREDSFIDLLQVRAILKDGTQTILQPKNRSLLSADRQYVKLSFGEQLLVEFDVPKGLVIDKYVLVASGYYIPYAKP